MGSKRQSGKAEWSIEAEWTVEGGEKLGKQTVPGVWFKQPWYLRRTMLVVLFLWSLFFHCRWIVSRHSRKTEHAMVECNVSRRRKSEITYMPFPFRFPFTNQSAPDVKQPDPLVRLYAWRSTPSQWGILFESCPSPFRVRFFDLIKSTNKSDPRSHQSILQHQKNTPSNQHPTSHASRAAIYLHTSDSSFSFRVSYGSSCSRVARVSTRLRNKFQNLDPHNDHL